MRQGLLVLALVGAPGAMFCEALVSPSQEIASRRIESAASEVQKIKRLVEIGAEARIKLDEAERNLADAQDQAILEGAQYTDRTEANDQGEDVRLAAAERRVDREKTWIEKIQKLIDLGFMRESDLNSFEKDLTSRQSDLAMAQSNALFRAEAVGRLKMTLTDTPEFSANDMEHYQGVGSFDETRDLKPLATAFETEFDHPLPISADGETDLHRSLGFDHRGRIDVAINPTAPEGVWLRQYLRLRKIPYYAFTRAVAGKATAAHIHIGPGSTRLLSPLAALRLGVRRQP